MIRTFYLSSAKAKDMVALLKSMLDVKHIHGNEALNTIVVRDQPRRWSWRRRSFRPTIARIQKCCSTWKCSR